LSGEFLGRLLIAQLKRRLAVPENKLGVMEADAGDGAFGVVRAHSHGGVVALRAFTIRNRAGEGLLRRSGAENRGAK